MIVIAAGVVTAFVCAAVMVSVVIFAAVVVCVCVCFLLAFLVIVAVLDVSLIPSWLQMARFVGLCGGQQRSMFSSSVCPVAKASKEFIVVSFACVNSSLNV